MVGEDMPRAVPQQSSHHCLTAGLCRCRGFPAEGSALTELALIIPRFLLLVFGVCDFGRLFFVETTLQNALRQAGRYAITGNHQPDPKHQGQTLSRVDSIIQVAQQAAIGIDVTDIKISSVNGGAGSAGGPGDTVIISLTSDVKLITPVIAAFFKNGTYTFTVSVRLKNEPFPPSDTV
jgi:Flp pilus assembly protein TadG